MKVPPDRLWSDIHCKRLYDRLQRRNSDAPSIPTAIQAATCCPTGRWLSSDIFTIDEYGGRTEVEKVLRRPWIGSIPLFPFRGEPELGAGGAELPARRLEVRTIGIEDEIYYGHTLQ
jgi:hypothetical protein